MVSQHRVQARAAPRPGVVARFVAINKRLSHAVERRLPESFLTNFKRRYEAVVADHVNDRAGLVIVDIGGGKRCPYLPLVRRPEQHSLISIDYSVDELKHNTDVAMRVVADVVRSIPVAARSVDVLSSRSVLEHLEDVDRYFSHCAAVLAHDGLIVHAFPCRFSPFSVINRLLPDAVARRLLFTFQPQWQDSCGFKAYYDRCYYSGMKSTLEKNGFDLVRVELAYYQAIYYDFFLPLYLVMTGYDLLIRRLGIRDASCQMLFVARRQPGAREPEDIPESASTVRPEETLHAQEK